MKTDFLKYFLAANSSEGFVSHFESNYDFADGWRAYIIKGGPGTGKSSFMKYVVVKAVDKGLGVELCPCSSDPDSLDGVIIKDIKVIILDGTAPHVVEPRFAGVCEEIINLGEYWNSEKLRARADEIVNVTAKNKKLHKTAAAYISAAGELMTDNYNLAKRFTNAQKARSFGARLAENLIPKHTKPSPKEWVRFIGGVTPKGVVAFKKTVEDFYQNVIVIDDKYGVTANEIIESIRKTALERGQEIITLKNPFLPSKITDHILIPALSVAFVREYEYINFATHQRRIHARRFYDINLLRECRARITFNRRVTRELLMGAIETLSKAKATHDKLEKYYINAMDFKALTLFAEEKAKEILMHKV